jgi:hypothetical protein
MLNNTTVSTGNAEQATAPSGALSWRSAAGRSKQLRFWRRAVTAVFGVGEIRVAWALADLFNIERGYAFARNAILAKETSMPINRVQDALLILQKGGAILRWNIPMNGKRWRVIYPAAAIITATKTIPNGRVRNIPDRQVRNIPDRWGPNGQGPSNMITTAEPNPQRRQRKLTALDLARIDAARRERRQGRHQPHNTEQAGSADRHAGEHLSAAAPPKCPSKPKHWLVQPKTGNGRVVVSDRLATIAERLSLMSSQTATTMAFTT